MFDILIKGGLVIDGSGAVGIKADLAVEGEKISAIEPSIGNVEAKQVIDASGKVVSPGFIDMHSHGDFMLPFLPTADAKIHQGITLEVVGNCGSSMAPNSPKMIANMNEDYRQEKTPKEVKWGSFEEYMAVLRNQGVSVNVAALVGHGTVREKVMGMSDAAPTQEQMAAMKDEVKAAMQAGAIGFSTGLIYTPNVYAGTEEVISLARVAAENGGLYTSHIRGEGPTLLEAIDEALEVGRRAETAVEISHLKASGINNWHKMPIVLEKIEAARASGMDVNADMYPYPASNTGLTSLIPSWTHVGGRDAMIARLQDPKIRATIEKELQDPISANGVSYDGILISSCPLRPDYEGRSIQNIADERGQNPLDAVMDILIEVRLNAEMIMFTMKPENVALGLQAPYICIGTDGGGGIAEGPLAIGKPHPRNFGTMARVLGTYCREQKLFSLEEAIRKMTSLPATKLNLRQRGFLKKGYFADLVIFDPQTVADVATFVDPRRYPSGIEWVVVNGKVVIENGKHTGARPGVIL